MHLSRYLSYGIMFINTCDSPLSIILSIPQSILNNKGPEVHLVSDLQPGSPVPEGPHSVLRLGDVPGPVAGFKAVHLLVELAMEGE